MKESGAMDSVSTLWAAAVLFPIILFTSLCISCRRRRIPVHITEMGYYDDKSQYTPPSTFTIVKRPVGQSLPRTSTSQSGFLSPDFLTVPRSPLPAESRRSSVGRDVIVTGFPFSGDGAAASAGASSCKRQKEDEEESEYNDPNYSNDDSPRGYITVLPDETGNTNPDTGMFPAIADSTDNRESLSSVALDYVNVGAAAAADSPESVESQEAADDNNYVNVGDPVELKGSDDDEIPDYENMKDNCNG